MTNEDDVYPIAKIAHVTPVTDICTMPPGELSTDMDTDVSYDMANMASDPPGLSAPREAVTMPSGSPEDFTTAKGDIPSLPDHQIRSNGGASPLTPSWFQLCLNHGSLDF